MRETEAGCLTPLGVGTEMLYEGPHLDGRKQMMELGEGGMREGSSHIHKVQHSSRAEYCHLS